MYLQKIKSLVFILFKMGKLGNTKAKDESKFFVKNIK